MLTVIKGFLSSKKFWVAVLGGAVVAGMNFAGVTQETQSRVVAIIATLLGAIGLADFGKSAPK